MLVEWSRDPVLANLPPQKLTSPEGWKSLAYVTSASRRKYSPTVLEAPALPSLGPGVFHQLLRSGFCSADLLSRVPLWSWCIRGTAESLIHL